MDARFDATYHTDYYPGIPEHEVVLFRAQTDDGTVLRGVEGRVFDNPLGLPQTSIYMTGLAQVGHGLNRNESHLQLVDGHFSSFQNLSSSSWYDTWTVSCSGPGCPPAGTYGFLTLGVTLHGTAGGSDKAYAGYELSANDSRLTVEYYATDPVPEFNLSRRYWDADGSLQREYGPVGTGDMVNDTFYLPVRFEYGKPFDIDAWLATEVQLIHYDVARFSGWGSVMFANTATLSALELPAGAQLATASGAVYPVPGIPEPGTPALMLAGLVLFAAWHRRHAR